MNKKQLGRELTRAEVSLGRVSDAISQAPGDKLHKVRTRFDGLVNAYMGDVEGTAILDMLIAQYSLQKVVCKENVGAVLPIVH